MTREGDLAEGDPDAPHHQISLGERMLSSGPPRPGIGVGSKGTVGLRLPWDRLDAIFGDPDASSKFFGGKFCYRMIHTTQQTEWSIHPKKRYSEFNFSPSSSNKQREA